MRLAATGDEAAFTRLVEPHHPAMAKVAYVITGDVEAVAGLHGPGLERRPWTLATPSSGLQRAHAHLRPAP